jgi:hypothetical protein
MAGTGAFASHRFALIEILMNLGFSDRFLGSDGLQDTTHFN